MAKLTSNCLWDKPDKSRSNIGVDIWFLKENLNYKELFESQAWSAVKAVEYTDCTSAEG